MQSADKLSPLEKAILGKPEPELLQIVGHHATMRRLGERSQTLQTLQTEGRDWFSALQPQLAERLCGNETVQKLIASSVETDRQDLFQLVCNLIRPCAGDVPVAYVASLTLRLGLAALCKA